MLKRIGVLSLSAVLAIAALAMAHEGHKHLMGTVVKLDTQQMVVKTTDGKTMSLSLNKDTKYSKGKAAAAATDLKVGDRVVVHAKSEVGKLTATEIRFSSVDKEKGQEGPKLSPKK